MIIKNNNNRNLNHVFDEIFSSFPATWGSDNRNTAIHAPVNIYESPDAFYIDLNAPGRVKDDFKINTDKGILTISVEQKKEDGNTNKIIKSEFGYHSLKRSFSVTDNINIDSITARYENGILHIVLPKKEEIKNTTKQIEVK